MATRGKAVQIVGCESNGGYTCRKQELERILGNPEVADTPVAVYSIAGAFRKGKSFLLNLFLRYLWAEEANKAESWLDAKADEITKGFNWRGGAKHDTEGIWIWNKPIFKTAPNGRVAIFLMDTQGAFDQNTSVQDCSVIFGLSTLISSVQIYNVQNQIQEDILQNLELFTEYTKEAEKYNTRGEKPFQHLMFLIRDWADTSVPYGIEGGKRVLDKLLQVSTNNKDITSVRQTLRESFQEITCCLMPHPGFTVAERNEAQGNKLKIGDVREVFLNTLDGLVKELFAPRNVVVKTLNERPVTGKNLINCTLAYFREFKSGKMPPIGTILQATAKSACLAAIYSSKDFYGDEMTKKCKGYQNDLDFQKAHTECMKIAMNHFDDEPKFSSNAEIIEPHRENLKQLIAQEFVALKQGNEVKKGKENSKIIEVLKEAQKLYETSFEHKTNKNYNDKQRLAKVHSECQEEAIDFFVSKTEHFNQELAEANCRTLWRWIEESFESVQDQKLKEKYEAERREWLKNENAKLIKTNLVYAYNCEMNRLCEGVYVMPNVLKKRHEELKKSIAKAFAQELGEDNSSLLMTHAKICESEVNQQFLKIQQQNERNKEIHLRQLDERRQTYENVGGVVGGVAGGLLGLIPIFPSVPACAAAGNIAGRLVGRFIAFVTQDD